MFLRGMRRAAAVLMIVAALMNVAIETSEASMSPSASYPVVRMAIRHVAPSLLMGPGAGFSLVLRVASAVGVGYLVANSGALSAIKAWWDGWNPLAYTSVTGANGIEYRGYWSAEDEPTQHLYCEIRNASTGAVVVAKQMANTSLSVTDTWKINWVKSKIQGLAGVAPMSAGAMVSEKPSSSSPTDIYGRNTPTAPSLPSGSVKLSPGFNPTGSENATVEWMTDSQANDFVKNNLLEDAKDDGTPVDNPVDNASADARSMIPYLSNIQRNTETLPALKASTDCTVYQLEQARAVLNSTNQFMDNIAKQTAKDSIAADQRYATETAPLSPGALPTGWTMVWGTLSTRVPVAWFLAPPVESSVPDGDPWQVQTSVGVFAIPFDQGAAGALMAVVRPILGAFLYALTVVAIYLKVTSDA